MKEKWIGNWLVTVRAWTCGVYTAEIEKPDHHWPQHSNHTICARNLDEAMKAAARILWGNLQKEKLSLMAEIKEIDKYLLK